MIIAEAFFNGRRWVSRVGVRPKAVLLAFLDSDRHLIDANLGLFWFPIGDAPHPFDQEFNEINVQRAFSAVLSRERLSFLEKVVRWRARRMNIVLRLALIDPNRRSLKLYCVTNLGERPDVRASARNQGCFPFPSPMRRPMSVADIKQKKRPWRVNLPHRCSGAQMGAARSYERGESYVIAINSASRNRDKTREIVFCNQGARSLVALSWVDVAR